MKGKRSFFKEVRSLVWMADGYMHKSFGFSLQTCMLWQIVVGAQIGMVYLKVMRAQFEAVGKIMAAG